MKFFNLRFLIRIISRNKVIWIFIVYNIYIMLRCNIGFLFWSMICWIVYKVYVVIKFWMLVYVVGIDS